MRKHRMELVSALAFALVLGVSAHAEFRLEKALKLDPGGRFVLDSDVGGVTVTGSAESVAHVVITSDREDATTHLSFSFEDGAGTARVISLGQLALACRHESVGGLDGGLKATEVFEAPGLIYPFGAHVAVVDIDQETGQVRLVRYAAVDDCGRPINPLIVDGQVHGGVGQGVAEALYEEMVFDTGGQPQTGTLMDYGIPTAMDLPAIETDRTETPSPFNPLGAKGVGESGTIGAPIAIANAIRDALRPLGVPALDPPRPAGKVWSALQRVTQGSMDTGCGIL